MVTIKLRVLDGEIMVRRTRILNQSGLPTGRESEELLANIQLEGMLSCERNRWHSRLQLAHFDPGFILFPSCLGVICQVTTCFNEQDEQMWQNITVGSLKIFEGEQF